METVPVRKDPAKIDIYSRSQADQIAGRDPAFEYEYFSDNPEHPSFIGDRLKRHERGSPAAGYVMVEPWQVVHQGEVQQGKKRADDSAGVDTKVTHGKLILCKLPKAEHVKYGIMHERALGAQAARLTQVNRSGGGLVGMKETMTMGTMETGAELANVGEMLKE